MLKLLKMRRRLARLFRLIWPREYISPEVIKQMDVSMKAFKAGKKGKTINLEEAPDV